jgi:ABC-type phosphate transport system substrate-binding protein
MNVESLHKVFFSQILVASISNNERKKPLDTDQFDLIFSGGITSFRRGMFRWRNKDSI